MQIEPASERNVTVNMKRVSTKYNTEKNNCDQPTHILILMSRKRNITARTNEKIRYGNEECKRG